MIFFTKILDTLGTVLERQSYFAPKLGRDMATLILQYGDQRCFLIRSRSTANDAHEAPYVKGIKSFLYSSINLEFSLIQIAHAVNK